MVSYEETTTECLKEMFRRVGRKYPDKEFTDNNEWYKKETWTAAEESDFEDWMKKLLKKRYKWPARKIDYEVAMFLLMWGWKNKD